MKSATERSAEKCRAGCPISLDHTLCKACGICSAICPKQVYDRDELGYPIVARPEDCIQCLRCELHCPDFCIEIERRRRKRRAAGEAEGEAR